MGVLSVTLLRLLGIGDVGPLGLFLMVTAGMACGVLISVGGIAYLIQLARSQRELLRERGGILSLLSRTTSGRTRAIWLDVLAGLHVGASLYLILLSVTDREVGRLCLSLALTAAVIAWGLWFRRPWIRPGVVLVYGTLVVVPPILILVIVSTAKGDGAGFAILIAFYIGLFWTGVTLIAVLMLCCLYGRRAKRVFGEINALRFGLNEVFVLMLLIALMLSGIAQLFH